MSPSKFIRWPQGGGHGGENDERESARSVGFSGVEGAERGKYVHGCGGDLSRVMQLDLVSGDKKGRHLV